MKLLHYSNKLKTLLCLLCYSSLFFSCEDPENFPTGSSDINKWIYQTMHTNYLWNDEIPDIDKLNFSADPQLFFKSLLSKKDGKDSNGLHYYYSYIEKNKDYSDTRTSIDSDDTYGMEFVRYTVTDNSGVTGYEFIRILYILPNSPAEEAGLSRGDWITKINGQQILPGDYVNLFNGPAITLMTGHTTKDQSAVSLSPSRAVVDNPLYKSTVLTIGNHKIGYLLYNHFTTGPVDYNDHTYDYQMKQIFSEFKSKNITDLVLDLRYNGGGYLTCAALMSRMIVPESSKDDVFCITTNNKGHQITKGFNDDNLAKDAVSLNLGRKVYILVSSSTASASESVINGLKPFMDVILIGQKTEGKNVGSQHFADNKYEWALQPITMRITSKNTDLDYSNGFQPDYVADELKTQSNPGGLLPFGDPDEYMLSKAIALITGGNKNVKTMTPLIEDSNLNLVPIYKSVDRYQTNGVLITPEQ